MSEKRPNPRFCTSCKMTTRARTTAEGENDGFGAAWWIAIA
jgi:hypothetical protein